MNELSYLEQMRRESAKLERPMPEWELLWCIYRDSAGASLNSGKPKGARRESVQGYPEGFIALDAAIRQDERARIKNLFRSRLSGTKTGRAAQWALDTLEAWLR